MKELLKNLWEAIKRFFHIGTKVVKEELEEAKEDLEAQLRDELAAIEAELVDATGEAIEILQERARVVYSKLLLELRGNLKD